MTAGVQPELRLEVSGKPVALPVPLAIRDGLVYVPVRAVYEAFGSSWGVFVGNDPQGAQCVLCPGNDAFRASSLRLEVPAGAPLWRLREWWKPGESTSSQGSLLGPSYLLYGELMVPAAWTGGEGMFPYARVHFDAQAATVRVDITPDWPGYHLPASPAGVRLLLRTRGPLKLEPGSNRPRTVLHGVATFRFIPPVPGTYVYTAVARLASNPEVELRATAAGAVRAP